MAKSRKSDPVSKWLISDELWKEIRPLLPKARRKQARGRPHISHRQVMNGIFFVLKTGCQWRALDATGICAGTTAHDHFQSWRKAGVFKKFWEKELKAYDKKVGIDWKWQALDTSFVKAPVAGSKKNRKKPYR